MIASRTTPPPFGPALLTVAGISMEQGYAWDGVTYPPPGNALDVGIRQMGLTLEECQRFQCRLDGWDSEAQMSDSIGSGDTFNKVFGTPTPAITFPTFKDRILFAVNFEPIGVGGSVTGGVIGITVSLEFNGTLTNSDATLFYPQVLVAGNTWISGDLGSFFLGVSCFQNTVDWVFYAIVEVQTGTGSFSIEVFREPDPGDIGTIADFYNLDFYTIKPTSYISS